MQSHEHNHNYDVFFHCMNARTGNRAIFAGIARPLRPSLPGLCDRFARLRMRVVMPLENHRSNRSPGHIQEAVCSAVVPAEKPSQEA